MRSYLFLWCQGIYLGENIYTFPFVFCGISSKIKSIFTYVSIGWFKWCKWRMTIGRKTENKSSHIILLQFLTIKYVSDNKLQKVSKSLQSYKTMSQIRAWSVQLNCSLPLLNKTKTTHLIVGLAECGLLGSSLSVTHSVWS